MEQEQLEEFNFFIRAIVDGVYADRVINISDCGLENQHVRSLIAAIAGNPKMSQQIQELDLSNNDITELEITGIGGLSTLNISDNRIIYLKLSLPNLKVLTGTNNMLSKLNTDQLPSLTHLIFNSNRLRSVNLDANQNLECIEFTGNSITYFDISKKANLIRACVERNRVTTLFIDGSPLSERFSFSSNSLDSVSLMQVIACKNFAPQNVIDVDHILAPRQDHIVLSADMLATYFAQAIASFKRRCAANVLTECARECVAIVNTNGRGLPKELAINIVIDETFKTAVVTYLSSIVKHLLGAVAAEGMTVRQSLITDFADVQLKIMIKHLCDQAKTKLASNKSLDSAINRISVIENTLRGTNRPNLTWLANDLKTRRVSLAADTEHLAVSSKGLHVFLM